jgi:DNA-binding PucR family transcriptional regulator
MSVTVADCLKLPALRKAEVVAGKHGLDKIVTAVSVLEYAHVAVLVDGFFIGNELIISALISIKDDIEEQCALIRRLHEMGEVGLIIYYVGIFIPELDSRLLQTADELDFPLICMPQGRIDFRYSEVISEVLETIVKDQMQESRFVSGMIDLIAQLQERQRTIDTVLRMLSDRLRCSLILVDLMYEPIGYAAWPMGAGWNYREALDFVKHIEMPEIQQMIPMQLNNTYVNIYRVPITIDRGSNMHLVAIDETRLLTKHNLKQAAEVIELFVSIWKYDFGHVGADELLRAILNDEPDKMRHIARILHIDVESINSMWIIKENGDNLSTEELRSRNTRRVILAKLFLQEHHKQALIDIFEDNVIAFMNYSKYAELEEGLAETFVESLNGMAASVTLAEYTHLATTTDVRDAYMLLQRCFSTVRRIYPASRIVRTYEIQFARTCMDTIKEGENAVEQMLAPLKPLRGQDNKIDLIDTLAVFLLDAHNNIQKTGSLMFLHKNTVKYRVNKIKQCLGYDVTKMPEAYNLYLATALDRLLRNPG